MRKRISLPGAVINESSRFKHCVMIEITTVRKGD